MFGVSAPGRAHVVGVCGKQCPHTGQKQPTGLLVASIQFHSSHLSAVWSCLASRASLLKVFHIASVSGVISRVSKKAVALERKGRKHRSEAGSGGAEGNPGAAGAAGGGKKGQKHGPLSRLLPWLQGPIEL